MESSANSCGHNASVAAEAAIVSNGTEKKEVGDVAAAEVTNCTAKINNNGSPIITSPNLGNATPCAAPETTAGNQSSDNTATAVQQLRENFYTSPSTHSSNGAPAGAMDTTPMAKKRLDMLEIYKKHLAKREEARWELEKIEKEASTSGIPLLEDYAKNPLVLSLPQDEGSPVSPSRTPRTVPAFNNKSIESERFFVAPQQQEQHAFGGFPNVAAMQEQHQQQHQSPAFVMMNNQMMQADHFNRQQQLEQQLLYQQHQPSDLILQNNNIAGVMATMAMAPGVAHINDDRFRQQSRLASNLGAGTMTSAVPHQFLPNGNSAATVGMAMGAAPIDSPMGERNDYTTQNGQNEDNARSF